MVFGSVSGGLPAIVLFGLVAVSDCEFVGHTTTVYFAMVTILSMGLGLFAPPVGIGFYIVLRDRRGEPG